MVITTQGSFSQPQAAQSSSHDININRCIYTLCFCNEHTRSVLATTPVGMAGLEPTAYALEGHCSFHLRYIPMCVSISCMPTFKALTQRNTYGYFYFRRASASYLRIELGATQPRGERRSRTFGVSNVTVLQTAAIATMHISPKPMPYNHR